MAKFIAKIIDKGNLVLNICFVQSLTTSKLMTKKIKKMYLSSIVIAFVLKNGNSVSKLLCKCSLQNSIHFPPQHPDGIRKFRKPQQTSTRTQPHTYPTSL